ncbi:polysaccharide biosynthesis protein CapD [Hypericibacter terrae]|uniref:Polysaccharide biosynthesis protein CapD n=1 Tax=Hypericibacter terrae TaxID=2602015 RepID=A0A5J6MRY5_9PROT|nr:nucleoside-diphosphate sugar epimerase/dehydratase [Hypericibacter terrae]QEX19981.1 polysaccharide biosynthesis protein CapD [Hypericibacter terrae]
MAMRLDLGGRAGIALLHDTIMAAISFPLALYLRLGAQAFPWQTSGYLWLGTAIFTIVAATVFVASGFYRGVWRYASLRDMIEIGRAVAVIMLLFVPALFLFNRLEGLPRSTLVINAFVLLFLLGAPRFAYRIWKDGGLDHLLERSHGGRASVLLIGAGDGAELFLRDMARGTTAPYHVVGLIDPSGQRVGRRIQGVPVAGNLDAAAEVIDRLVAKGDAPQRLIVTDESLDGAAIARLLELAESKGLTLARLPRLTELKPGARSDRLAVRPIALEDVLGRPRHVLDRAPVERLVAGRRLLVTGAGGSIGAELCRQIAALAPARLTLLDHSESLLHAIATELAAKHPGLALATELCDLRDRGRLERAVGSALPEILFHAAALKHVPVCERHPDEAVLTNVVGTRHLAAAAIKSGAGAMVVISTDKAVQPESVLGATKKLAESYCQALDRSGGPGATRFVAVRFGNVLGSSGSVVPLFQKQIAEGGPVTVTDAAMTRFFMTTEEAVELVLQASAPALAGEARGKVLVLEMGRPVRILDLARQMIRLSGRQPERDIAIAFTGLRPGEKLTEMLFAPDENPAPTAVAGVLQAEPRAASLHELETGIDRLAAAAREGQAGLLVETLTALVPDYRPQGPYASHRLPGQAAS